MTDEEDEYLIRRLAGLLDCFVELGEREVRKEAKRPASEYGLKNITWKLRMEGVKELLDEADERLGPNTFRY